MKTIAGPITKETHMKKLDDHPAVKRYRDRMALAAGQAAASELSAVGLREMCRELGVDDVGFVESDRPS